MPDRDEGRRNKFDFRTARDPSRTFYAAVGLALRPLRHRQQKCTSMILMFCRLRICRIPSVSNQHAQFRLFLTPVRYLLLPPVDLTK